MRLAGARRKLRRKGEASMRRPIVSSVSAVAVAGGMAAAALALPGVSTVAVGAGSGPRIVQIEAFAAPGGSLLAHAEVLRGSARPPTAWFTVAGVRKKARREALDGGEGPRYRVNYSVRFAPSGQPLRVGDTVRVTLRACTTACTTLTRRVRVESWDDR